MFRQLRTLGVLVLVLFLAAACGRRGQPTPTPTSPPPTNTAVPATNTPVPATATAAPATATTEPTAAATTAPTTAATTAPTTAATTAATTAPTTAATTAPTTAATTAATTAPTTAATTAPTTAATTAATAAPTGTTGGGDVEGDAANGQTLFTNGKGAAVACTTCHMANKDGIQLVGPPLWGVADRAETRVEGLSAVEYLHQSIIEPNAHVVEGFAAGLMPDIYETSLTEDEINDIIAYLLTLRD